MGNGTFVKTKNASGVKGGTKNFIRLGFDVPLFIIVFTLVVFGALMVYSASWDFSLLIYDSPTQIFTRQLMWLVLGTAAAIAVAFFDYHYWQKLVVPMMVITVLALIGVLVVNEVRFGAARTLSEGSYQPSELAKLVTVIYLSVWLYAKRDQLRDVNFGLIPLAGILGVVGGLIFLQPDLSAVLTVVFLGILLFFLAGGEIKQLGILGAGTFLVGVLVVRVSPTGSDRMGEFLSALDDPTQASYHLLRSFEAFIKGGWFGVGIGKANTKLTGLPVPPTDSIFAVIGEELGVIGASIVLALFVLLLWRGILISRRAPDQLGSLLAAGLCFWIGLEAYTNMAVMLGLLPFAGNALPFISAGGSNLTVSLVAVGILMNISRSTRHKEEEVGRSGSAIVDLRRRKRRRHISRPGRSSSAEHQG